MGFICFCSFSAEGKKLMFLPFREYPVQILISSNSSKTSNLVKAIPLILDKDTACLTRTESNHPHRLCLPVTVPNSCPFLPNNIPSLPLSSVGKGPDPTLVV